MRVVKYEHSCVRMESDGAVLVIDPGAFTTRQALDGADVVLITHEHVDHLRVESVVEEWRKRPSLRVFCHPAVAGKLDRLGGSVTTVDAGEEFIAATFHVRAYGGWHAIIHPDIPRIPNLGYLVDGAVYHPGDSFAVPTDAAVDTLFVPIWAPWLKGAEAVDFVRAVAPRRAFALHDYLLTDAGLEIVNGLIGGLGGADYARLVPGEAIDA